MNVVNAPTPVIPKVDFEQDLSKNLPNSKQTTMRWFPYSSIMNDSLKHDKTLCPKNVDIHKQRLQKLIDALLGPNKAIAVYSCTPTVGTKGWSTTEPYFCGSISISVNPAQGADEETKKLVGYAGFTSHFYTTYGCCGGGDAHSHNASGSNKTILLLIELYMLELVFTRYSCMRYITYHPTGQIPTWCAISQEFGMPLPFRNHYHNASTPNLACHTLTVEMLLKFYEKYYPQAKPEEKPIEKPPELGVPKRTPKERLMAALGITAPLKK